MALLSPGVEVTVIDESFFAPVVSTSIPYILLATAQDKVNSTGDVAIGTTAENANVVTPITSRRELVTLFGNPAFVAAQAGGVVQAHELNEYGLQVAYSLLGVTNRVYVQRADIDLGELTGTSVRPTNTPANGTLWLDLADTDFGLFEWNASDQTFNKIAPIVIDDVSDESGGVPNADIGTIGSYAVVTTVTTNPVYYKDAAGAWLLVGGDGAWLSSSYTVQGTVANPTVSMGDDLVINTTAVTATGTSLTSIVADINGTVALTSAGISASELDNKLTLFADETSESNGSVADGNIDISGTGTMLADVGIAADLYYGLEVQLSKHTSVPEWKLLDAFPRPTGSVWVKTTTPNLGADFEVNLFNDVLSEFNRVASPLHLSNAEANNTLDAVGGGINVAQGALYFRYDTVENGTVTYTLYERLISGTTEVAGAATVPVTFNISDSFGVQVSEPGSDTLTASVQISLSGTTAATFVADVLGAAIDGLEAYVNTAGQIVFVHNKGGTIVLTDDDTGPGTQTPIADAGFSNALTLVEDANPVTGTETSRLVLSNWVQPTYTASLIQPSVDPADGTKWYFSAVDEVDLMMHDGTNWLGYQNVANDARNYDLSTTNPDGPIVSASEPLLQSDGTPIVPGDIWIDTSVINDYPIVNRWTELGAGATGWVTIDNADDTSENGILFADARWSPEAFGDKVDVITGDMPTIVSLLTSDELDLDAPDPALFPRGTILWNTRRSGFNVKQYAVNYFNATTFTLPGTMAEPNTWRTVSGLKLDGSPYMGSGAVRNMIVTAMKGGIDSSIDVREERTTVNLLAAPHYPELISNLTKVNTDRKETSFVIGDSPMTLPATSAALADWASNANLASDNGNDGLISTSEYLGVYYPSGLSNDLEGNAVVMPSSHMSLHTIIRSDNVSYPWIAPAGVRRGKVINATSIGYVDATTGEFQSIGVGAGLRDVLYTNNVNPISILPGSGITIYGQKTRAGIASSLDRINVARLTANLRFVLDLLARPFIFEPNDKLTRDEFKNEIEKYLNELVAKRGIFDYLVVCDDSNNTPARIDRNELWADVAIEPVKAAEFIFVPLRLKNTGEI